MLLPWSKRTSIALGANAIAQKKTDEVPKLLIQNEACFQNSTSLVNSLIEVASQIETQSVQFILSNHFVRYVVMPWQEGVVSRQEWIALAESVFRKSYGQTADYWDVRVSLNHYGQPVLASAIDQTLVDSLRTIAEEYHWQVDAIEPLFSVVMNQINLEQDNGWLILGEPSRILLAERLDGRWQQISVINPPIGMEIAQTQQLLIRQLANLKEIDRPKQVFTLFSPQLTGNLQMNGIQFKAIPLGHTNNQIDSALWMASL